MGDLTTLVLSNSERAVLNAVFCLGTLSQKAIAEQASLSQQSTSRICSKLFKMGLLACHERTDTGKRGYPSTDFKLNPEFAYTAGITLMPDAVALAILDFSGTTRFEARQRMASVTLATVAEWLTGAIAEAHTQGMIASGRMVGAGLAVSGSFLEDGRFNTPYALEEWSQPDIAKLAAKRFGMRTHAENDGNAAALGESILGVGRQVKNFAYIYIGSGVGGGVVLDGKLWRGRFGNAGEFAGGLAPNLYPFPNLELLRQILAQHGRCFDTVNEMCDGFDPDWPGVKDWIARVQDSLSIIASNASSILDVEMIVIGGQIPPALTRLVIPHIAFFDTRRRGWPRPMAKIVPAEAQGEIAAYGAALLPFRRDLMQLV